MRTSPRGNPRPSLRNDLDLGLDEHRLAFDLDFGNVAGHGQAHFFDACGFGLIFGLGLQGAFQRGQSFVTAGEPLRPVRQVRRKNPGAGGCDNPGGGHRHLPHHRANRIGDARMFGKDHPRTQTVAQWRIIAGGRRAQPDDGYTKGKRCVDNTPVLVQTRPRQGVAGKLFRCFVAPVTPVFVKGGFQQAVDRLTFQLGDDPLGQILWSSCDPVAAPVTAARIKSDRLARRFRIPTVPTGPAHGWRPKG